MLTQSDIARVLAQYDLGQVYSARPAAHGLVNETAFAETGAGKVVVRRNQRRLGRASLQLRHELMAWLRTRAFPSPRVIPTRNGESSIEVDGRIYEVCTFIDGDDFNPDRPTQLAGIGSILARFHMAVEKFPAPTGSTPRYCPSSLLGLTERLMQRDALGDLTTQLSWYDRRAAELTAQLGEKAYAALPHLLIHGDVHRDNFLFRGDAVVALLDFDQVCRDARLVDLADALVDFATGHPPQNWSPWGVYDGPLDPERTRVLLEGYQRAAPLSPAEVTALPIIVEVVWMQGNLRRILSTQEAEPDYHIEVLEQGRWLSNWMDQHRGEII